MLNFGILEKSTVVQFLFFVNYKKHLYLIQNWRKKFRWKITIWICTQNNKIMIPTYRFLFANATKSAQQHAHLRLIELFRNWTTVHRLWQIDFKIRKFTVFLLELIHYNHRESLEIHCQFIPVARQFTWSYGHSWIDKTINFITQFRCQNRIYSPTENCQIEYHPKWRNRATLPSIHR